MAADDDNGFIHPDRVNNNPAFAKDTAMLDRTPTFTGNGDGVPGAFDFGSGQPLPPAKHTGSGGKPGFNDVHGEVRHLAPGKCIQCTDFRHA